MIRIVLFACGMALMAVTVHGAAVPSELVEAGKVARATCMKESGVTEDLIDKAGLGDFADDDKLKCYFKCIFEQFGLIEDGEINFDVMLQIVPDSIKEAGTRAIQNCRTTTGKDMCERTYNIEKCFFKDSPEEFFVV